MISNYYVLAALADEWHPLLQGSRITEAYSQSADEVSFTFDLATTENSHSTGSILGTDRATLRMSTASPLRYVLLSAGSSRARRNTADVLASVVGASVETVRVVAGDRILCIDLTDGRSIRLVLFGSNANAYVLGTDELIEDAFQSAPRYAGKRVATRTVVSDATLEQFAERWHSEAEGSLTCGQVLSRIEPLFNRFMADEVVLRARLPENLRAVDLDDASIRTLFTGLVALRQSVTQPPDGNRHAMIYWEGSLPARLSLFESGQMAGFEMESFDSVSEAVSIFVRRSLGNRQLSEERGPVLKKISTARKRAERRVEELERELTAAPRSETYERFGHILMAQPATVGPIANPYTATDSFDGGTVEIPVDAAISLIDNANRYYEKARGARAARESAAERLSGAREEARHVTELFSSVSAVQTLDDWRELCRAREAELKPWTGSSNRTEVDVPFRQFDLGSGYMVWVGKNAKQNEMLSSKAARRFDLWFHARGFPGSHVVLRIPQKGVAIDSLMIEKAARIAAYYSKARGGTMVPVIVTEAKYVRRPRGAAPGSVVVERERVLLVEPGLPTST